MGGCLFAVLARRARRTGEREIGGGEGCVAFSRSSAHFVRVGETRSRKGVVLRERAGHGTTLYVQDANPYIPRVQSTRSSLSRHTTW